MAKSAKTLSEYFNINKKEFQKRGILDAFLYIDSAFFVDPLLLKTCKIPEFSQSREKIEKYFENIIRLLKVSKVEFDLAWRKAFRLLIFKELRGIAIGYGSSRNDGNGVGPILAKKLVKKAHELVKLGIEDPEIFELIGFFENDYGPDRLSDMTVRIILDDLLSFTERISKEFGIKGLVKYKTKVKEYSLALHPNLNKPIVFLPHSILRDLPVAKSWEDISEIAWFNQQLRERLNSLMNGIWRRINDQEQKDSLRKLLLSDETAMTTFLKSYKKYNAKPYNFVDDPKGELTWLERARKAANEFPLKLTLPLIPTIDDIEKVVDSTIIQFKKLIEVNGWNKFMYEINKYKIKIKNERNSQLLFFGVADTYCEANNIDINREPDAGTGLVDFKFSRSYRLRFLVEIKKSSNPNLIHGYEKQLPTYEVSERTKRSAYVIIKVNKSKATEDKINEVIKLEKEAELMGEPHPKVYIIDGLLRPTASKIDN